MTAPAREGEVAASPCRHAMRTASTFECTPSLARMLFTWLCTVSGLMPNASATSAVDAPAASVCRISRSRLVSLPRALAPRGSSRTDDVIRSTNRDRSSAGRTSSSGQGTPEQLDQRSVGAGRQDPACPDGQRIGRDLGATAFARREHPPDAAGTGDRRDHLGAAPIGAIEIYDHEIGRAARERVHGVDRVGDGTRHRHRTACWEVRDESAHQAGTGAYDEDADASVHTLPSASARDA